MSVVQRWVELDRLLLVPVRLQTLARTLGVDENTVRRDIEALEALGQKVLKNVVNVDGMEEHLRHYPGDPPRPLFTRNLPAEPAK